MAFVSSIAAALASQTLSLDIPNARNPTSAPADFSAYEKKASALLTPPTSFSPDLVAHGVVAHAQSPPPINIVNGDADEEQDTMPPPESSGVPLSKGALSGLDAAAAITPSMLAKHHLPGIMLGNGPRPIRYVMGELTQSVPGFSRIPPAKARRLVVAALESRNGGGPDGSIAFCKTGWGRWDAHVKGSSKDSAIGSFDHGRLSPPRSERSSYAMSHTDSGVHMPQPRLPSAYRDHHSGESWSASSIREEDEFDMDMDVPENEADKMSLDEASLDDEDVDIMEDDTDDEDWTAPGPEALRKASLPTSDAPRLNYNALSSSYSARWQSQRWSRRPSTLSDRHQFSMSLPTGDSARALNPALATSEEHAAIAALMSMGSM
ncbi:Hypothetical protein R9X50_00122100 [Acrodontium crateriforme]|uniref:Sin3 binding protein-domain-containing protein n=1 Tax=Acrodontium crateriforme TaxID=150365 RepID=A0AAQ3LZW2_9PEZI|nr:Hypothetical protein R9X50_00122100 [Acrodontium crateriforme]